MQKRNFERVVDHKIATGTNLQPSIAHDKIPLLGSSFERPLLGIRTIALDKWANSLQHLCNDVVFNPVLTCSSMTFHTSNDRFSQWARASVVALITFYSPFAHAAAFTAEQLFEAIAIGR